MSTNTTRTFTDDEANVLTVGLLAYRNQVLSMWHSGNLELTAEEIQATVKTINGILRDGWK